ncbi:MAG: hypothetical protein ACOXZ7_08855 [Sphaerochaeta sp.]
MSFGNVLALKKSRLLLDVSLWSGNLINLQQSIDSTAEWADFFHIDVGRCSLCAEPSVLPGLDQSDQSVYECPIATHLMMTDPLEHLEEFVEAGSSIISLHVDQGESPSSSASDYLKGQGVQMGLVLRVEDEVSSIPAVLGGYRPRVGPWVPELASRGRR